MPTQRIRLLDLETKYTRVRAQLNKEAIQDYWERYDGGSPFPPLDVFSDGEKFYLVDGFHREAAATAAGCGEIDCEVIDGTLRDAMEAAIRGERNRDHGVRRSNADKRKAVLVALGDEEWRERSDSWLAEMCGVSDHLVAQIRKEIDLKSGSNSRTCDASKTVKRKGKDGKKQAAAKKPQASVAPTDAPAADAGPDDASFDPAALEAQERAGVDIKGLASPYGQAVRAINGIKNEFTELAADPRTGAHLSVVIDRIKYDCGELVGTISAAAPVCVCKDCGGEGCEACSRTGFWTRSIRKGREAS